MALAANALSTVASFQALGAAQAALPNARAEALINAASDTIERFCGRSFARQVGIVENVAGFGGPALWLARNPVEAIASITFDGSAISATDYTLEPEKGRLYRASGWVWTASIARAIDEFLQLPGTEEKLFQVTYTGGYALPQNNRTPGTYPLPYDLEEACLALATYRMSMSPKNQGLSAEQAGNASRSFSGGKAPDVPDYIAGMLEPYVRIR
jgi:hypothetical protein